ncbi:MAG: cell envelope integrity protein CreD [Candidatus Thiodiazotropha sp.]
MKHPLFKKLLVIAVLTLLLMIPVMMIEGVVVERSSYRDEARQSIATSWTGEQKLVGPILVVPYKEHYNLSLWDKKTERYVLKKQTREGRLLVAPELLQIDADVTTETRKRGIYSVPVYHSQLAVSGSFALQKIEAFEKSSKHDIEWQQAYLSVLISDVRGVEIQPLLRWQDKKLEFVPDAMLEGTYHGMHASLGVLSHQNDLIDFSFELNMNGMESLQFAPVGKNTRVDIQADWPDPSFFGRYLPSSRAIDGSGFKANWNVSSFSSNTAQYINACESGNCSQLMQDGFGVKLFNSVDIYQQSERSVKYAVLFIGLTFASFFLYEVMKGLRLHPMHYLLVGLSLSVFYLLLISLSEHMAFHYAYIMATMASASLIGFYIGSVLASRKHGMLITTALLLLYGMLYAILSSEDNSLLMGSLLIFSVLSLVMVVTRRVDWYALTDGLSMQITKRSESEQTI